MLPMLRRISAARMQIISRGRLARDIAAGERDRQPAPEYIPAAVPPSEAVWLREQARRRAAAERTREGQVDGRTFGRPSSGDEAP